MRDMRNQVPQRFNAPACSDLRPVGARGDTLSRIILLSLPLHPCGAPLPGSLKASPRGGGDEDAPQLELILRPEVCCWEAT